MKRTTMTAVAAGLAITSIAAQPTDTTINVIPIRDVPNIELIRPSPKVPLQVLEHDTQPVIEVVFVLDTTGSMGGLIEGAKQKIWSIANMMSTGNPAPKNSHRTCRIS